MKVLFLGDIVSDLGREIVKKHIPILKKQYNIDIVIANAENAAHGKGITNNIYQILLDSNVDVMTMGNHFLAQKENRQFYDEEASRIVRPYNVHKDIWGLGTKVFNIKGFTFRVTNILGKIFINELQPTNPFDALDEIIASSEKMIHIVDLHAEATAEKLAIAWNFQDSLSAVIGTHTHVPTADERILPEGLGYITDVGMCGPRDGIIGVTRKEAIYRQRTGIPTKFEIERGVSQLNGVYLEFDDKTYKCLKIERINIIDDLSL